MMVNMVLIFLSPLLSTCIYWVIYRKAGFSGAIMTVCLMPLILLLVSYLYPTAFLFNAGGFAMVSWVTGVISFAPMLVLAIMKWPRAA